MTQHEGGNRRRYTILILLALLIAFLAVIMAQNAQDTADINNLYLPVVNNTDLYPSQRVQGVTYWANESPIDIYLIFHATGTGASQAFDSNLSINGTVLQDNDFRTASGVGFHDHWPLSARIPKGANYSVTNSSNVFNIEWREYPILSGKNGTLSVNTSVSDAQLNLKVNKSGDTMTGKLGINTTPTMSLDINGSLAFTNLDPNFPSGLSFVRFAYDRTNDYGDVLAFNSSVGFKPVVFRGSVVHINDNYQASGGGDVSIGRGGNGFNVTINSGYFNVTNSNITLVAAGKGFILKNGTDPTKCGFLYWSSAGTLNTQAITCP